MSNDCTCTTTKRQKREPVPRSQLPPDIWHVEHAAAFLGLSVSTVHKLSARGELPCSRPAGRLFFDPDTVVAWAKGEAGTSLAGGRLQAPSRVPK